MLLKFLFLVPIITQSQEDTINKKNNYRLSYLNAEVKQEKTEVQTKLDDRPRLRNNGKVELEIKPRKKRSVTQKTKPSPSKEKETFSFEDWEKDETLSGKIGKEELERIIQFYTEKHDFLTSLLGDSQNNLDRLREEIIALEKKVKEISTETTDIRQRIFMLKFSTYYFLLSKMEGISEASITQYQTPTRENFKQLEAIFVASKVKRKADSQKETSP